MNASELGASYSPNKKVYLYINFEVHDNTMVRAEMMATKNFMSGSNMSLSELIKVKESNPNCQKMLLAKYKIVQAA